MHLLAHLHMLVLRRFQPFLCLPFFSTQRNDRSSDKWRVMDPSDERGGDFFGGTVFNIASRRDSPEDDTHKGHQRKVCRMHGIIMLFIFSLSILSIFSRAGTFAKTRQLRQIPLSWNNVFMKRLWFGWRRKRRRSPGLGGGLYGYYEECTCNGIFHEEQPWQSKEWWWRCYDSCGRTCQHFFAILLFVANNKPANKNYCIYLPMQRPTLLDTGTLECMFGSLKL